MLSEEMRQKIISMLSNTISEAEKRTSIDEKRKFYLECIQRMAWCIGFDNKNNVYCDELNQLLDDYFLNVIVKKPKVFEDEGYHPWLESKRSSIEWKFYDRYERYLLKIKNWKPCTVINIKKSSDVVLDHIAYPQTDNYFNKKGLVIGDIQSGKTANYTALINKALDVGYKIIIVLAGLTRELRNQTQRRLDCEVLGYETKLNSRGKTIGVGLVGSSLNAEGLTFADSEKEFGDMKRYFSSHTLDKNLNPIVAIVKKNASVLEHLNNFLTQSQNYCYTNGKLDIPVLIIDDEVDQASVDTKNSEKLENSSTINKKIRTILGNLNRYSYVGYTATPFANVFINPDREDIYPKDFIISLPTDNDYCGIKEYFGVDAVDSEDSDYTSDHVQDLFVNIDDIQNLFSNEKVNVSTEIFDLNDSLKEAILSFIVASSIKKTRGIKGFNSMLIHIARFKNPSTTLKPVVQNYIEMLYRKLKYESFSEVAKYKDIWNNKFEKVSETRLGTNFNDKWEDIEKFLMPTLESILNNIKVLNGDSGDLLDYTSETSGDFIVIGGDKLSRGLTIEGLIISYYYRKSINYDSLLQMGRWFGYRKGWIDVCRVYTTIESLNNFITVGKVLQQFKLDIDEMNLEKLNPREVGQRILYSPKLIPTARNKMKNSTKMKISFSGSVQQIISFDPKYCKNNLLQACNFIEKLGFGEKHKNNKVVFKCVNPELVIDFLSKYKECHESYDFGYISIKNRINYIENLNKSGELTEWTVVINSLCSISNEYDNSFKIGNYKIYKPTRTLRDIGDANKFDIFNIRAAIDPSDFTEIFDENSDEYQRIKYFSPSKNYSSFSSKNAILSIYIFDLFERESTNEFDSKTNKLKTKRGKKIENGQSVCGIGVWFSKATNYENSATEYYVSKDYLDREAKEQSYYEGGDTND